MAQYFIEVVPTDVFTFFSHFQMFQYSVKENTRPISEYPKGRIFRVKYSTEFDFSDHSKGSHGIPGLYFKYDVSALKVVVRQDRENIIQFVIRLSSITAGIVVISGKTQPPSKSLGPLTICSQFCSAGFLNTFIQFMVNIFLKTVSPQSYQQLQSETVATSSPDGAATSPKSQLANNLISNANHMADLPFNYTIKQ